VTRELIARRRNATWASVRMDFVRVESTCWRRAGGWISDARKSLMFHDNLKCLVITTWIGTPAFEAD
jgi:hypothetical protein